MVRWSIVCLSEQFSFKNLYTDPWLLKYGIFYTKNSFEVQSKFLAYPVRFDPKTSYIIRLWSFEIAAPSLWNSLALNVRMAHSLSSFRSRLKGHLCTLTFYPVT